MKTTKHALEDVRSLFENEENYSKPIKTKEAFNGHRI